jgi:hypothetical protein
VLTNHVVVATDPANLTRNELGKRGKSKRTAKDEVKETRLPLEACGTSVGIGPSASTLIHHGLSCAKPIWQLAHAHSRNKLWKSCSEKDRK